MTDPALLMPDPQAQHEAGLTYPELRRWWAKHVNKTVRLGKRRKPEPGVVDLLDEELG